MKIKTQKAWAIIITVFCALLGAFGQLLFKLGSSKITLNLLTWINWQIILGLFAYGTGVILFTLILKKFELSFLYPIIATSYIWVALFSAFLLKEVMFLSNWVGIVAIVAGVSLATMK